MRNSLLWLGLSVGLAANPASADDWLALTLYPGGSVYQAAHLEKLVGTTQGLWAIRDADGEMPIGALDSLATTNAIAVQGDDVRFRRLIEQRELTPSGLKTMAALVDRHPLLGPRLITKEQDGTHFWFRLTRPYSAEAQTKLLNRYAEQLATAFGANCQIGPAAQGALSGLRLTEWQMDSAKAVPAVTTLKSLDQIGQNLRGQTLLSYSAADVLGYLREVLDGNQGLPQSEAEIAQLYMIAESLRSRDLQALARPDLQRLNLVAMGPETPPAPRLDGYQTTTLASWSAAPHSYLIVDCR